MTAPSAEPQRFGKYQIIERIAAGGMAEIFKARLEGIGGFHRTFAIKRILPNLTASAEFVDMLVDEAKIAGLLSHANIVQILDLGAVDDQVYIAMEYVNGRDLGKLLARTRDKGITLPVPHAVYVLIEMLKGLEYAHNRTVVRQGKPVPLNIVHRDISPANVLISFQGEVKLTDFGIAKASVKALETMSGVVKGRFDYMSPEQAAGGEVDHRSDLFSAGVVFYELLTGIHPFRQPGELQTVEAIRRGEVVPPSAVNPDVPPVIDQVVARALAVDPAARFQTATQFKEALDRFFHDAGFIFSASTLATFVKGLFPETDARGGEKKDAADDIQLEDDLRPLLVPRASTASAASQRPAAAGLRDADILVRNLAGAPDGPGLEAGGGDDPTVIRPSPLSSPAAWGEASTVIRPDPSVDGGGDGVDGGAATAAHVSPPPPAPGQARGNQPTVILNESGPRGEPTTILEPEVAAGLAAAPLPAVAPVTPPAAAPPVRPAPRAEAPRSEPPRREPSRPMPSVAAAPVAETGIPGWVHVAWFFVALLGLGLGVIVGVLIADPRGQTVVVKDAPVLEVHFPAGAKVTVDGKPVGAASPTRTSVTAGQPVVVKVEGSGYAAETSLTLDWNQMRVLVLSPVDPARNAP